MIMVKMTMTMDNHHCGDDDDVDGDNDDDSGDDGVDYHDGKDDDEGEEVKDDVENGVLAEKHHQIDHFVEHDDRHLQETYHEGNEPVAELPLMVQRELHELVGCVQLVCHRDVQVSRAQEAAHHHTDACRVGLNRFYHFI